MIQEFKSEFQFSQNFFRIVSLMLLFMFFRTYFFFNLSFSKDINLQYYDKFDVVMMYFWGLRFDLCVLGFLLIPIYFLYLISLLVKNSFWTRKIVCSSKILVTFYFLISLFIYYFNLPFFAINNQFGLPFWMRIEDYVSLWDSSALPIGYWQYGYLSEFKSYHFLLLILFCSYLMLIYIRFPTIKLRNSKYTSFLYLVIIFLMARGKLGNQHLRFEDSRFSKNTLLNELSLNPLWLVDKLKEQVSQEMSGQEN